MAKGIMTRDPLSLAWHSMTNSSISRYNLSLEQTIPEEIQGLPLGVKQRQLLSTAVRMNSETICEINCN